MLLKYSECPLCSSSNLRQVLVVKDYTVSGEQYPVMECGNCTARFTQDVPVESEAGRYYKSEDYISHSDTSKGLVNNLYHRVRKHTLSAKRGLIQKSTGLTSGRSLDVGAGTGAFVHTLQEAGWDAMGLEIDEAAREKAMELYDVKLMPSFALNDLPSESFDAITLWHVLEHVYTLHEYLEQLKRILKPGGKLFIAVPNYTSYDAQVYQQYWAAYDVPRHLYHFSPVAMTKLLTSHGLKPDTLKPMWFDSFYVSLLSEKYHYGKPNLVKGFIYGLLSNAKALFAHDRCSSVIYVIGK